MFAQIYTVLAIVLTVGYAALMLRYLRSWQCLPAFEPPADHHIRTGITVLIPARNEAENIGALLGDLAAQQRIAPDLLQVIVLDDHSSDATPNIVRAHPRAELLRLADFPTITTQNSFKKAAIELGIDHARHPLIVGTDADCRVPPNWLYLLGAFYEIHQPVFIAAPVNFHRERNFLQHFQSLDFIGMMGITGAGIHGRYLHMCNGANLAYEKAAFHEVGGFLGIDHLASGDDMLLLQKMAARYPDRIGYLKNVNATVRTEAKPDWKSFVAQRRRWASKSSGYQEVRVTVMLAWVFIFCWGLVITAPLVLLDYVAWPVLVVLLAIKLLVDWLLLSTMAHWFYRRELLRYFLPAQIMHIVYIAWVGLLGALPGKYEWKGRRVR